MGPSDEIVLFGLFGIALILMGGIRIADLLASTWAQPAREAAFLQAHTPPADRTPRL